MARKRKTIEQYEREAKRVGKCLIHPACCVARKIYMMRHGALPSHIAVCHTCDNHWCIEDKHHFAGTWKDNIRDAVRKGRHSCFRRGGVRFNGPHSKKSRTKIGEASRLRWQDPAYKARLSKTLKESHLAEIRHART